MTTTSMTSDYHQAFGVDIDLKDPKVIQKLHLQFGHASAQRLFKLLYHAHNKSLPDGVNLPFIKDAIEKCESCQQHRNKPIRPRFGGWLTDTFNDIVCIDLVELEDVDKDKLIIAHLIDVYSGLTFAQVIESKSTQQVVDFLWNWRAVAGRAPRLLFSDNGGEFCSKLMDDFCSLHNIDHKTTAPHHPFSNGLIERHNGLLKETFKKIIYDQARLHEDSRSSPEAILSQAVSTLNALPNDQGYSPYFLAFTQPSTPFSLNIHGSQPSQWNDQSYLPQIQARLELQKHAREAVFSDRILKQLHTALKKRVYHKDDFVEGEKVYFWRYDQRIGKTGGFSGPATLVGRTGNMRIIEFGGKLLSVPRYDLIPDQNVNKSDVPLHTNQSDSTSSNIIPPMVTDQPLAALDDSPVDVSHSHDFFSSDDVVVQWQNDTKAHQDRPQDWLSQTHVHSRSASTKPRYRTIPGFKECSTELDVDLYGKIAPRPFDSRPSYQRDVIHKVPGKLITNMEEHLRLKVMPQQAKLNFKFLIPDYSHTDMIVEEFTDPLTNCVIRHNTMTGDKYVDSPSESNVDYDMTRFFDSVQPNVLHGRLSDFHSIYPSEVISRSNRMEVLSPVSSRPVQSTPADVDKRFLEFSVSPRCHRLLQRGKVTESDEDWVPGKSYLEELELSESAQLTDTAAPTLVDSIQSHTNATTNISDAYIDYLEHSDNSLSLFEFDQCFHATTEEEVGVSSYRTPSKHELDVYRSEFDESKRKELDSWINNGVFEIIPAYTFERGDNLISSKWIQNVKYNASGRIVKFKSRLVIRGFQDQQLESLQKDSPTVDKASVRQLLQFAANHKYDVYCGDISTAFLQGRQFSSTENRTVLMKPPSGTNHLIGAPDNSVWKLVKPAYGLADAPRRFYENLKQTS